VADARSDVLARVRSALGSAGGGPVDVPRDYRVSSAAADLDRLAERIADYRATVTRSSATGVAGAVAATLAGREVHRLLVPPGLPAEWLAQLDEVEVVTDDGRLSADDLDGFDGVLTTCAVAIEETGTLVLDGSAGMGRRALTLVPDYHLCVVPADRAVPDVPGAVARLDPTRPLTWISGPSATSDIELNRVEGVHGPRTLDVIVVE
jgi:L-lactate dehydrogenase complex protein LldG